MGDVPEALLQDEADPWTRGGTAHVAIVLLHRSFPIPRGHRGAESTGRRARSRRSDAGSP